MKRKIFLICILLSYISFNLLAENMEETLSLEKCIEIALENNLDIALARIDFQEAEALYERYIIVTDQDLIEEGKERLENYTKQLEDTKLSIAASVEESYYNILRSLEQLENSKKQLDRVEEQLKADELKYEVGLISELSIELSRDSYDKQKDYLQEVEINIETSYMRFNNLLGRDLDTPITLSDKIIFEKIDTDFNRDLRKALKEREDINNLRKRVSELDEEYHNINNIYTAKVDIEKAENILEKEKIKLKQLEQNIYFQVRNQIHSLEKAWAGIVSSEKEIERKNRELDSARLQYESGVISTREIVDYQEKLVEAENKLVQLKWDYNLALKEYYRVLGIDSLDMFIVLE